MTEVRNHQRALVLFDSKYGNTGQVAKQLAEGLHIAGIETACLNILDVNLESLQEYDLIAFGAPTQAFTASKQMKDFLRKFEHMDSLRGKQGFAFDTKFASPLSGSAAKYIEKKLSELGMKIVRNRQSAIVKKTEGPLEEGELEAFERIGFEIGNFLTKNPSKVWRTKYEMHTVRARTILRCEVLLSMWSAGRTPERSVSGIPGETCREVQGDSQRREREENSCQE